MERFTNNIKCEHMIIESEGFNVCCKCGIVQDNFVFNNCNQEKNEEKCESFKNSYTFKEKCSQLYELESKGLISKIVVNDAIDYTIKWYNEKIPLRKFHHAYAVYLSARKNKSSFTLKEIAFFLQINVKDICKIEKYVTFDFNDTPYEYVSKYCNLLNLTFMDEKLIVNYLKHNYKTSDRSASHIAAGVIFLIFPNIEKKLLSRITWVAPSTFKKIANEMRAGHFM